MKMNTPHRRTESPIDLCNLLLILRVCYLIWCYSWCFAIVVTTCVVAFVVADVVVSIVVTTVD